jgi:hypothetical protein
MLTKDANASGEESNDDNETDAVVVVDHRRTPAEALGAVKTWLKPMVDELKQLVALTSATSLGSAKVISTH